jgi:hypothetical protein
MKTNTMWLNIPQSERNFLLFTGSCLNWNTNFLFEWLSYLRLFPSSSGTQRCSKNLAAEFNLQPLAAATIYPLALRFVLILASPCFISHVVSSLQVYRAKFCTDSLFLVTRGSALITISSNSRHFLCFMPHSIFRKPLTCTIDRFETFKKKRTIFVGTLQ